MATVRYTVLDGEVIAEKRSGVRREYVPDPLGSTAALLDSTQSATDTFSYWPYGEESSRTGTTETPFRFVGTFGYYRDSATREYVRARYLSTSQGRWMTEDPLGLNEGGPDPISSDINLYVYCRNNPVTLRDPLGLAPPGPGGSAPCYPNPKTCYTLGRMKYFICHGFADRVKGCKISDTCEDLKIKGEIWIACAVARGAEILYGCYVDPGHKKQAKQAADSALLCSDFYKVKKCAKQKPPSPI